MLKPARLREAYKLQQNIEAGENSRLAVFM